MPLPTAAPRETLHTRTIECRGFRRDDGLWDIEAHLTDIKSYAFENAFRGEIEPGEPLHDMWLRLTVDDDLVIRDVEAVTDAGPFEACPAVTPRFAELKGLSIAPGWNRKVHALLGGARGCTHLVELLRPLATVAFQTIWSSHNDASEKEAPERNSERNPERKPAYLDKCHALRSDGEVVREHYPRWYTGD